VRCWAQLQSLCRWSDLEVGNESEIWPLFGDILRQIEAQCLLDTTLALVRPVSDMTWHHAVTVEIITDSDMLIAEYPRQRPILTVWRQPAMGAVLSLTLRLIFRLRSRKFPEKAAC